MTVSLYKSTDHKAVVFTYTKKVIWGETIEIKAKNLKSKAIGNRKAANIGTFTLFYPKGLDIEDVITVKGSEGGSCSGTCKIKT